MKEKTITLTDLAKARQTLKDYKAGKSLSDNRIISNEQWWKMRHWGEMEYERGDINRPMPKSAWLFNSIANKHADAMDNIPEPCVLPRQKDDEEAARELSRLLPCILERCGYEKLYSDGWWYKLKNGTMCQSVMWDPSENEGQGDIVIKNIDILNLFWQPGIKNINDSRNLFYVTLVEDDLLKELYPELSDKVSGDDIGLTRYKTDDGFSTEHKTAVIDWYYKKQVKGKTQLHYVKFAGDNVLYSSEDDPLCKNGFYDHGKYPFVLDPLFVQEGSPCGFGYIDIMKDAQGYIDKLGQVILEHTVQLSRKRFFIKQNSAVREEEFADFRRPFVHVAGNITNEDIREISLDPLDSSVMAAMDRKIEELKETSGNRDFSQGGTSNGVTAASAIAALQEAGNKLSRDMLKGTYYAFSKVCYLVIELIRQFYDSPRFFRVENEFAAFDNSLIRPVDEIIFGMEVKSRKPVFDIVCKAAKKSPFSKAAQNELAKELFKLGFFNPAISDQALACIDMMDFEGKESIKDSIERIKKNYLKETRKNDSSNNRKE